MTEQIDISPEFWNDTYKKALELASLIWTNKSLFWSNYRKALKNDLKDLKQLEKWLIDLINFEKEKVKLLISGQEVELNKDFITNEIIKIKSKALSCYHDYLWETIW
jgi:hypothetical protein